MKIRHGFVSNSSSSSFVINKHYLSAHQIDAIHGHIKHASEHFFMDNAEREQQWDVEEKESEILISTYMDNFDMWEFLCRLNVPNAAIRRVECY